MVKLCTLSDPLRSFRIAVDSREQKPYRFAGGVRLGLKTGDYSLAVEPEIWRQLRMQGLFADVHPREKSGLYLLDNYCTVERKRNIEEWHACCTGERDRFERELLRLVKIPHRLIVCEFPLKALKMLDFRGFAKGASATSLTSVVSWIFRHNTPILFCDNRAMARAATYEYLRHVVKVKIERKLSHEN